MSDNSNLCCIMAENVINGAKVSYQRPGQYLFNHLPDGAGTRVAGTLFDPFHKDMESAHEIHKWMDEHLIFNWKTLQIIGVFDGNNIVWEA